MTKGTVWRFGLGLITVPVLLLVAVGVFNLNEIVGAPKQAPIAATPEALTAGTQIYLDNCAACHGLPDQPRPHAAPGLWPEPPQFFQRFLGRPGRPAPSAADLARFAGRRAVGSYMTVRDGVPGTGMPNFRDSLSETQMWQVALMMGQMQSLPPAAEALLKAAGASPLATPAPAAAAPGATAVPAPGAAR